MNTQGVPTSEDRARESRVYPDVSSASCSPAERRPAPWRGIVHAEQRLLRQALAAALARTPGAHDVSTATDPADCLLRCTTGRPRIVLIVAEPPQEQVALGLVRAVRTCLPGSRLLLIAAEPDIPLLHAAKQAGASLLLPLAATTDELAAWTSHLLTYTEEEVPVDAWLELLAAHARPMQLPSESTPNRLSQRQRCFLALLGHGLTNAAIASEFDITEKTVRNQMTRLFANLGASSRTEALMVALAENLVQLDDAP